jgi:hypothetical protein
MPGHRRTRPSNRAAAKQKGGAVSVESAGAMQPIGAPKSKAKAKPEVAPAKRIAGVGTAKATVVDASMVTLQSLAVGNGGAVIKVTEQQATAIRKLGDFSS